MSDPKYNLRQALKNKQYYIGILQRKYGLSLDKADDYFSEVICRICEKNIPDEDLTQRNMVNLVKNHAVDMHRKKEIIDYFEALHPYFTTNNTDSITYKSVRKYIYRLSDKQRNALILRFRFSLTQTEIAALLDISLSTAKARTWRALEKLKTTLWSI